MLRGTKKKTGTASITLFEMVEFETQTFFEEEAVTKFVLEHAMKLPVRDSSVRNAFLCSFFALNLCMDST